MASPDEGAARLMLPPGAQFAAVAADFVRGLGAATAIEPALAERLALIAEEVLAATPADSGLVGLTLRDRRHAVRLEVAFASSQIHLAGLDQSRRGDAGDGADLGLYLAARLADRLTTEPAGRAGLRLCFDVARRYPPRPYLAPPADLGPIAGTARQAAPAMLALLVDWAEARGEGGAAFRNAARVLDRLAAGDLAAGLAFDARQRPIGGLIWQPFGRRLMTLSGPALLLPEGPSRQAVAQALLEDALGVLVRSGLQGLVVLEPAPDLPQGAFEVIGQLPDATGGSHPVLFRALEEDPGCIAWVPDALRAWVGQAVRRLGLGRDLERPPPPALASGAAMAADTDRAAGQVTLRPLLAAGDAAAVAGANVALFRAQGFSRIHAVLDLGQPDHGAFAAGLIAAGLAPAALIPDAAGDLVLLAAGA